MNQNSQQYSLTLALEGQEKIHTFEQGWLQLKLQKEGTKREQELPRRALARRAFTSGTNDSLVYGII